MRGYYGSCLHQSTKTAIVVRLTMPSSPHEFFKVILLSSDYRPSVDRPSTWALTNYWPIHRWSIDELSAKCRWSIGERKAISAETHLERLSTVSRLSVVRLSSESLPTIDRLSTAISTESRPTIDQLSTDYRPSVDRLSTALSTDRSVDTTYSKHDPRISVLVWALFLLCSSATFICYLGWIL